MTTTLPTMNTVKQTDPTIQNRGHLSQGLPTDDRKIRMVFEQKRARIREVLASGDGSASDLVLDEVTLAPVHLELQPEPEIIEIDGKDSARFAVRYTGPAKILGIYPDGWQGGNLQGTERSKDQIAFTFELANHDPSALMRALNETWNHWKRWAAAVNAQTSSHRELAKRVVERLVNSEKSRLQAINVIKQYCREHITDDGIISVD